MLDNVSRGTIPLEDLRVGMSRSIARTFDDRCIQLFAEVSGDQNPVHLDDGYARETIFGGRIAHGMLTASLISAVIGEQLPGHGTIYLIQDLRFLAPVFPNDTVLAQVTVKEIRPEKRRVVLECLCSVGDRQVLKGEATVLAPTRSAAEGKHQA